MKELCIGIPITKPSNSRTLHLIAFLLSPQFIDELSFLLNDFNIRAPILLKFLQLMQEFLNQQTSLLEFISALPNKTRFAIVYFLRPPHQNLTRSLPIPARAHHLITINLFSPERLKLERSSPPYTLRLGLNNERTMIRPHNRPMRNQRIRPQILPKPDQSVPSPDDHGAYNAK
ncbi:hypothetical protein ACFX2C_002807 [Malus domestica]